MRLLAILQTDCPTCQLMVPYLNRLAASGAEVSGLSQDPAAETDAFVRRMDIRFPLEVDAGYKRSIELEVGTVPTLLLLSERGRVVRSEPGFDKTALNELAGALGLGPVASAHDGNPSMKPGCTARHLEPPPLDSLAPAPALDLHGARGSAASRLTVDDALDPFEYCFEKFGDALPVVPPTVERVQRMVEAIAMDPHEVVARVPPCFGVATVEKIAANAVMAGCKPELMRVLVPLTRAVCDERFNAHGLQATTHFAAPLIVVNGPVRKELSFHSGQNLFSNVSRANSTLGRALQLILIQIGGARPAGGIDMSALGNPGKFSFCIAESEEDNPWDPLHVEAGFQREQSAVTLFGCEAPMGVSEHKARTAQGVLKTISYALRTVWSYRVCLMPEAMVILCPEHVETIRRSGWSKEDVRQFLFENTGIPHRCFEDPDGEGVALTAAYSTVTIDGEPCYRKFRAPEQIKIVVAGGHAGKFSAICGSWQTGPRGSQMVTYPV